MIAKKLFLTLAVCIALFGAMAAAASDDIEQYRSCAGCGMDRKAYGYSRVLLVYQDGSSAGFCSLHCACKDMAANQEHTVKMIQVADRVSRALLVASDAYWVMGGSKRGVMTQQPKWAFSTKAGAEEFVKEFGGKAATWEEVLRAAREELD